MKYLVTLTILTLLVLTSGCEQPLRFAPSENIKQSAELTYQLANKINREGTKPQSSASRKMVQGTQVALSYTGRPKKIPDPEQFETIVQQGQADAVKRPDPWQVADHLLELAIGGVVVLGGGGAGAVKLASTLKKVKEKTNELKEVAQSKEELATKYHATNKANELLRMAHPDIAKEHYDLVGEMRKENGV